MNDVKMMWCIFFRIFLSQGSQKHHEGNRRVLNNVNMLRRSTTLSPNSTFVFIIGICKEWESGRASHGDIALEGALRRSCGIPGEHICHVKDEQATKSNIIRKLKHMLGNTDVGDTLELYFGGHGVPQGVATVDGKLWKYSDIIQQIEEQFGGDRAVFLFDTCHAGW